MSSADTGAVPAAPSGSLLRRIVWHWRHNPKRELWIAWWTMVVFYQLFGLLFFVVTRTQPPPHPSWEPTRVAQWFDENRHGLLIGFAFVFIIGGMTAIMNALIARLHRADLRAELVHVAVFDRSRLEQEIRARVERDDRESIAVVERLEEGERRRAGVLDGGAVEAGPAAQGDLGAEFSGAPSISLITRACSRRLAESSDETGPKSAARESVSSAVSSRDCIADHNERSVEAVRSSAMVMGEKT